jgi:hypothetical protein
MLEQQELRLADFLRQPPELQTQPEKAPGLLAADIALVLVAGLGTSLVLRRRRRT